MIKHMTNEHLINTPLPHSYQAHTREALESLVAIFKSYNGNDAAKDVEIFNRVKNELDFISWRSDKQIKALKDKIKWLDETNRGLGLLNGRTR